jgi:peptidoglycan hydrolase CwlO-like protein
MSKTVNELIHILLDLPKDSRIDFVVKYGNENIIDTNDFDLNTSSKETYIEFIIETDKVSELKEKVRDLEDEIEELKEKIEELEEEVETKDNKIDELESV